jgi:hypothetical protein
VVSRTRTLLALLKWRLLARAGTGRGAELLETRERLVEKSQALKRVRRQITRKDRELAELRTKLIQAQSVERLVGASGAVMPVFFVVGRARSGTTWLRTILNSHPDILCWGEGRFFERSFRWEDYERSQLTNIPPVSLYGAVSESEYLRAWISRSVWTRGGDMDRHLADLTRVAIDLFLARRLSQTNKRIVGDKTPFGGTEAVGEIAEIYPEAKVIHIVRDGRDAAVSMIHHMWSNAKNEGGIYELEPEELERREAYRKTSVVPLAESLFTQERLASIAAGWNAEVGRAVEDGPALLGDNYVEVRYEDLLERPMAEIRRLLEFLDADASEATVERLVENTGFERSSNRKRGLEDSYSRFRKGITGDWKNVFTDEDKRIFKKVAGDLLIKLGYEEDENW